MGEAKEKWKDFLSSIGIPDEDLDDYARKLMDNGYESNTTEIFLQVTLNDLIYMGITKNAHQKVILMAINKVHLMKTSLDHAYDELFIKYDEEKERRIKAEHLVSFQAQKEKEMEANVEKLSKQIGELQRDLAQKEKELLEVYPLLSIRKAIESFECLIAPELTDPKSVFNHPSLAALRTTGQQFDYHEGKWRIILSKNQDTRVQQLKRLLTTEKIPEDQFCRSMAGFFIYCPAAIHVPSLKNYSEKKMKCALNNKFSIYDDVTIRCVTKVLMKIT